MIQFIEKMLIAVTCVKKLPKNHVTSMILPSRGSESISPGIGNAHWSISLQARIYKKNIQMA